MLRNTQLALRARTQVQKREYDFNNTINREINDNGHDVSTTTTTSSSSFNYYYYYDDDIFLKRCDIRSYSNSILTTPCDGKYL